MLEIPIQPVPSQLVKAVLASQNCQISIYQKAQGVFVDLNSNGSDIEIATLAHDIVALNSRVYSSFIGNLLFLDSQGNDDPTYTGFGIRFHLLYLTAAEFAAIVSQGASVSVSTSLVDDFVPIGAIDGSNTSFFVIAGPINPLHALLFLNGLFQTPGIDYIISGSSFLMTEAPPDGAEFLIYYQSGAAIVGFQQETPGGVIDGSNLDFTLLKVPSPALSLQLFKNGLLQTMGIDYALTGADITFANAPVAGSDPDIIYAVYRTAALSALWNFEDAETPAGSGSSFSLAHAPNPPNSLQLYYNGDLLSFGIDFTLSANEIDLDFALGGSDALEAFSRY